MGNNSVKRRRSLLYHGIGLVITAWAGVEKQVSKFIYDIEKVASLPHTNLKDLPRFKDRKGHLRQLIETHGTKPQLAALDRIYQRLVEPRSIRHDLAHELIFPADDDLSVSVTTLSDLYNGDMKGAKTLSSEVILAAAQEATHCMMDLLDLSDSVAKEITNRRIAAIREEQEQLSSPGE